ncbi:hypothetical protein PINS_up007723 [Pythium insidiosum]|nr:hypothetical protein PINS_up007723 [Pythium insidiosum]
MWRSPSQRKFQAKQSFRGVLRDFGLLSRVDAVAQQAWTHENEDIFRAVRSNNVRAVLALIDSDPDCLSQRDSIGISPLHAAFLFGYKELGKEIVRRRPDIAALQCGLDSTGGRELSPYEGENILHIAIVSRDPELARWLMHQFPELLEAETIGSFFRPSKPCYFGGTPFLFAVSSDQIDVAFDLLAVGERVKKQRSAGSQQDAALRRRHQLQLLHEHSHLSRHKRSMMAARRMRNKRGTMWSSKSTVLAGISGDDDDDLNETTVFMTDHYGNSALHLAVVHDLPHAYDFVAMAMHVLNAPHFSTSSLLVECERAIEESSSQQEGAGTHRDRRLKIIMNKVNATEGLNTFLRRVDDATHDRMKRFLMQRNDDELTPLSLAATIGNQRMLQHIMEKKTTVAWTYGPIVAVNVPLLDLEEPELRGSTSLDATSGYRSPVDIVRSALGRPREQKRYITAIQCMCSYERLSSSISRHELESVLAKRLQMLEMMEIRSVLRKKWKYVGRERFMRRLLVYIVFLTAMNVSALFPMGHYRNASATLSERVVVASCDVICYGFALTRLVNEVPQLVLNFRAYLSEEGVGRLDNVCMLMVSIFLCSFAAFRGLDNQDLTDACSAVALVFAWFYALFFLFGFRSTGPFVIMILTMIQLDLCLCTSRSWQVSRKRYI